MLATNTTNHHYVFRGSFVKQKNLIMNTRSTEGHTDFITTLHPLENRGIRLLQAQYQLLKRCILEALELGSSREFQPLIHEITNQIAPKDPLAFRKKVIAVAFDLEVRGMIYFPPLANPSRIQKSGNRPTV